MNISKIFTTLVLLILYLADIVTDILVLNTYWNNGDKAFFSLQLIGIAFPCLYTGYSVCFTTGTSLTKTIISYLGLLIPFALIKEIIQIFTGNIILDHNDYKGSRLQKAMEFALRASISSVLAVYTIFVAEQPQTILVVSFIISIFSATYSQITEIYIFQGQFNHFLKSNKQFIVLFIYNFVELGYCLVFFGLFSYARRPYGSWIIAIVHLFACTLSLLFIFGKLSCQSLFLAIFYTFICGMSWVTGSLALVLILTRKNSKLISRIAWYYNIYHGIYVLFVIISLGITGDLAELWRVNNEKTILFYFFFLLYCTAIFIWLIIAISMRIMNKINDGKIFHPLLYACDIIIWTGITQYGPPTNQESQRENEKVYPVSGSDSKVKDEEAILSDDK